MFCLQNHPKYAPIYLNLPSGNKMNSPETWYYSGFRGSLLPRGYTQALREPGFAWEIVGVAICINRAIFAVLSDLRQHIRSSVLPV